MFGRKSASITVFSLAGIALLGLFGCGSNSSLGPGANTTGQARTFNALVSSNATVNFALRTAVTFIAQNVTYGTGTSYTTQPAGNGVNDYVVVNTLIVASGSNDITPNDSYTLIAGGDVTQPSGAALAPKVFSFTDNIPSAATLGGNVAVRVIDVAPTGTAAYQSIDLYNVGAPLAGLTNVTYGNGSGYVSLPAGTYNLTLHSHANNALLMLPAGTTTTLSSLPLTAGKVYTFVVFGEDTNATHPFDVKLLQDN